MRAGGLQLQGATTVLLKIGTIDEGNVHLDANGRRAQRFYVIWAS
jgi:hypothetical protein